MDIAHILIGLDYALTLIFMQQIYVYRRIPVYNVLRHEQSPSQLELRSQRLQHSQIYQKYGQV